MTYKELFTSATFNTNKHCHNFLKNNIIQRTKVSLSFRLQIRTCYLISDILLYFEVYLLWETELSVIKFTDGSHYFKRNYCESNIIWRKVTARQKMVNTSAKWSSIIQVWLKLSLLYKINEFTAQKMKFSIKDSFSKYDQIRRKLRIWSNLLKKSLMENFIFCAINRNRVTYTLWKIKALWKHFSFK